MRTVRRVLEEKGFQTWSVTPDASVLEAIQLMASRDVGALLICEGDNLLGIFTERDYLRRLVLQGKSSATTPVHSVMTQRILYVHPDQSLDECMALMTEKHIRHLPVLENNRLIGLISMRDVVKDVISEKQFMIEQLENYIMDRR